LSPGGTGRFASCATAGQARTTSSGSMRACGAPLTPALSPWGRGRPRGGAAELCLLRDGALRPPLPPGGKVPEGRMRGAFARGCGSSSAARSCFLNALSRPRRLIVADSLWASNRAHRLEFHDHAETDLGICIVEGLGLRGAGPDLVEV